MTGYPSTFGSKILTDHRCKPELPKPYGFVTDFESSLQKKFGNVTESELVSQTPENGE
jgi:hypothetical protein